MIFLLMAWLTSLHNLFLLSGSPNQGRSVEGRAVFANASFSCFEKVSNQFGLIVTKIFHLYLF